jgi:FkbH-like protein
MRDLLDLDYAELLERNRELGESLAGAAPVDAALLANVTIDPLKELLEYSLRSMRIPARVRIGGFDNIVQESERSADCRIVAIFQEPGVVVQDLWGTLEADGERALVEGMTRQISTVLENLKTVPLVLLNRFCALPWTASTLAPERLDRICHQANEALDLARWPNVVPIDLTKVFAQVGVAASVDWRFYYQARALYSRRFLSCWVDQVRPVLLGLAGQARKALILDCDNTLWHGILGEDGVDGIDMGAGTPTGRIFREVQQAVVDLASRGVIVGLCSRNNPEEVDAVLRDHPDMVLRASHLSIRRVNWEDKVSNLRAIAGELNISLDAMAFVDDSPQELLAVEQQLPDVALLQVPARLSEYPSAFRRFARHFAGSQATAEDLRRTQMYQSEALRRDAASHFASRRDYLRSLGLRILVHRDRLDHVRRVAQLTQKTNQFNLTTKRYAESEILRMVHSDSGHVLSVEVSDRFGDYGISGVVIYERLASAGEVSIDTLLLSCRVLGRDVELALMDAVIEQLRTDGVAEVHASWAPTKKNLQVEHYYESCGFSTVARAPEVVTYLLRVLDYKPLNPFQQDCVGSLYA